MGHTYYAVYEHITFSTKHRQRIIDNRIQAELFPYLAAAVRNQGCKSIFNRYAVGFVRDAFHG